jgi:hypothetical protein
MEHVINAKLRNQAFWKFLVFFVVTTAIIVTAVYFDTDIRGKENASLRAQVRGYEDQVFNEQEFLIQADSARGLLDSLSNSKGNYEYYNTLIDKNLANMTTMANGLDSSKIYTHINKKCLSAIQSLQQKQRQVKDNSETIKDLSEEIEDYKGQVRNNGGLQLPARNNDF